MLKNIDELLKVNFPGVLTHFLRILEYHTVEKTILDCGAGGGRPPLTLFKLRDYT